MAGLVISLGLITSLLSSGVTLQVRGGGEEEDSKGNGLNPHLFNSDHYLRPAASPLGESYDNTFIDKSPPPPLSDFDEIRRRLFYVGRALPFDDDVRRQPSLELLPPEVSEDAIPQRSLDSTDPRGESYPQRQDTAEIPRDVPNSEEETLRALNSKPRSQPGGQGENRHPSPEDESMTREEQALSTHGGHPEDVPVTPDGEGSSLGGPLLYAFHFKTDDGIERTEQADPKDQTVTGNFSWTSPDGGVYRVEYTADEFGFHPRSSHLSPGHPERGEHKE